MNDQRYFDTVAQELRENKLDEGLWLKAMTGSDNDRNRARAAYVDLRVGQMKQQHEQQLKIARAAGKVFCSCPACDCAGPFPSRPAKKIGLLLSLMPLAGFYLMRNEMLPVAIMWWKHRAVPETAVLSTHLLYALAFVAPFFVVLIVTRGAVKCPSCGYRFWFNKKGIEGNTVLSSL